MPLGRGRFMQARGELAGSGAVSPIPNHEAGANTTDDSFLGELEARVSGAPSGIRELSEREGPRARGTERVLVPPSRAWPSPGERRR